MTTTNEPNEPTEYQIDVSLPGDGGMIRAFYIVIGPPLSDLEASRIQSNVVAYGGSLNFQQLNPGPNVVGNAAELWRDLESKVRAALGLIEGAVPNPDDERVNNLERDVRNQGRRIEALTASIDELVRLVRVELAEHPAIRVVTPPPDFVVPADLAQSTVPAKLIVHNTIPIEPIRRPPSYIAEAPQFTHDHTAFPMGQDQPAPVWQGGHRGLSGQGDTPVSPMNAPVRVDGDPTAPINPRSKGRSQTPEMTSPGMALAGVGASSDIQTMRVSPDENGKSVVSFVKSDLPKVGDTLRPMSRTSDIKVP